MASHEDEWVQREAFRGLANFAKENYMLDKDTVMPVIEEALEAEKGSILWCAGLTAACAVENHLGWDMGAEKLSEEYLKQWFPD